MIEQDECREGVRHTRHSGIWGQMGEGGDDCGGRWTHLVAACVSACSLCTKINSNCRVVYIHMDGSLFCLHVA